MQMRLAVTAIALAAVALGCFSGCVSRPRRQAASAPGVLHISPDVQIEVRSFQPRPFYIARRQRAYTAEELQQYLAAYFAGNDRTPARSIALIADAKGGFTKDEEAILAFAASKGIRVACLSGPGNAIDDLIFGSPLSQFGAHEIRPR